MLDRITGMAGWLRIVCAVALLCIGFFAHMPPSVGQAQPSSLELTHYAFPDGTLPVLCLPGDEGGNAGMGKGCSACRLNADFALPVPQGMTAWLLPRLERDLPPTQVQAPGRHLVPANASPRAPPSIRTA
ncbi:MAG: hypothetical protein M9945_14820 [Aquamicrobium sp.]|jgi:hypothetical protein|uniref:hypothetical protein n=1 Tax=Aquamicrobium sp. TaxID=1872579 RepID=UPI00349F0417|nr:hypothetical protein [Aquamicrobium sp.]